MASFSLQVKNNTYCPTYANQNATFFKIFEKSFPTAARLLDGLEKNLKKSLKKIPEAVKIWRKTVLPKCGSPQPKGLQLKRKMQIPQAVKNAQADMGVWVLTADSETEKLLRLSEVAGWLEILRWSALRSVAPTDTDTD